MKFMYDGIFGGQYFTCFSMNVFVRAWIFNRGDPKDSVLILANNVTADEQGLKHAIGYNGVVFKGVDIANMTSAVQVTSHFYDQSKLSKEIRARVNVAQWPSEKGQLKMEVEWAPFVGSYVIFKQGRSRINRLRSTEFQDILQYMRYNINAGKKSCGPCQMQYEDMDIDGEGTMAGCPLCNLS